MQQALLNLYFLISSLLPPSSHTAVHYTFLAPSAAPSPHRPHYSRCPCRRRVHLKSLAEAAGVELEEMIFFDNERGNCLVRIYAYVCICARTFSASAVRKSRSSLTRHSLLQQRCIAAACLALSTHTQPHTSSPWQDVAELGVTVAFVPYGVTGEAWRRALEAFPAPGEILDNRQGL